MFGHADSFWLYAMIRHLQPRKVIEIGSGFSSAVMLDTIDLFCKESPVFTSIESYADRLKSLLRESDKCVVREEFIQNVNCDIFASLEPGDILFVDSSHVGKFGSDVLHILNEILPRLNKGVFIHFHDIFYLFEYPRPWLENKGRAWNECYFIQAFLQYNYAFKIKLFGHYLGVKKAEILRNHSPLCLKNTGGSLWLEKVE